MAARYIRATWLALAISFALSANGFAGPRGAGAHSQPDAQALARGRLAEATTKLKERMESCRNREIILPSGTFAHVDLTNGELRTALSYFSVRANNNCIEEQAKNFAIASYIAQRAGIVSKDSASGAESPGLESLVLDSWWRQLQLEAKYRELPKDRRNQLAGIEVLREPFDLLESAKAIKLMQQTSEHP